MRTIGSDSGTAPDDDARAGERVLRLEHGALRLPVFLPDATRAVVRALDATDLERCGIEGVVVSLFHLQTRPGVGAIAGMGGVHRLMNWPRPILSDSGGFQVFSLLAQSPRMGSVSRRGFTYRLAKGAPKETLSPEKCIQRQFKLGTDILVCLDHCPLSDASPAALRESVENTVAWARACRDEFDRLTDQSGRRPLLFSVVQGGEDPALRRECAERLVEIGFDGYGFGGQPVTDEGRPSEMASLLPEVVPADRLTWGLGVGKPDTLAAFAAFRYDLFDCSIPTRDARRGRLYVFREAPATASLRGREFYDRVYISDKKHFRDDVPLEEGCDCHCCQTASRGYLRHLFAIDDCLGYRLATIHNLRFYSRLMDELRARGGEPR
jgi:queuine tRNA-ribosyltransferase